MNDSIRIKGARANNLDNLDLTIPRDKFIVFTGVSGSGKTSLAFDTIFAEGQRRYVESLSSYARQFLGQMEKPDVDSIDGLSPAISIDQKTTSRNPRSTVGTVTEIYDYLRLLYARVGVVHCPECGRAIERQTVDQIVDRVMGMGEGTRFIVVAPVVRGKKGEYAKLFASFRKSGFVRVKVDGNIYGLEEEIKLDKQIKHNISVVIDRLAVKAGAERRIAEAVETALKLADGLVVIDRDGTETLYSDRYACPDCGVSIEEVEPRLFSFNSPFGACPACTGLGFTQRIDPDLVIKNPELSINEGAMIVSGWNMDTGAWARMYMNALAKRYDFSLDTPVKDLPKEIVNILLYGNNGEKLKIDYQMRTMSGSYESAWEGVIPNLERRFRETSSEGVKEIISKYMRVSPCETCGGKRLRKEALAVTVGGYHIADLCDRSVKELHAFFASLVLEGSHAVIAAPILREIKARLAFLVNVGLDYLTLSRAAGTLSGGEAQRIRLATQIGSGLTGVLYILDEPSIGLHSRDNDKLISTLTHLRDLGNTLIVVEHDEDTMYAADQIVDIGPGAGSRGGRLVAQGTAEEIMRVPESVTGQYLSGMKKIPVPDMRRPVTDKRLDVRGAHANNLKNIDVSFPLGVITAVTGVSGSGKSSLVNHTLYPYLAAKLNRAFATEVNCDSIEGIESLDKVINIDQSPIGRTPRSNPATYTGAFSFIRELFASTKEAQERGYKAGRFSFNVKGGRCEACEGDGIKKIEMHFLPDVYVPCEVCHGQRYNRETLEVHYKGKTIADVLDMTVEEAVPFFENVPSVYNKIRTLNDVGLGYIKLGQPATTLSGGEAQRVKLATELSKRATGRTVYILDEPTTGLHMADVHRLIDILQQLAAGGNTVIVIEHNMDIIKNADYIIDMGPEGGDGGGTVVAYGTPEEIAACGVSYTGKYLKKYLLSRSVSESE